MILTDDIVSNLAKELNIVEPRPSNKKYNTPVSRLHEIGHFAVTKVDWYHTWCYALRDRQIELATSVSPWIPTLEYKSCDPMPDEYGVQLWVALVLKRFDLQDSIDPKSVMLGDRVDANIDFFTSPTWGHGKNPWEQLKIWDINPLQNKFLPKADDFILPFPTGKIWYQIIENFIAIQDRYPNKVPNIIDYRNLNKSCLEALQKRYPG